MVVAPGTGRILAPGLGLCHLAGLPPSGFRHLPNRQEVSRVAKPALARLAAAAQDSHGTARQEEGNPAAAATAGNPTDVCECKPRPGHRRAAQGRQILLGQELARGQSRGGQDHRASPRSTASRPRSSRPRTVPREKFTPLQPVAPRPATPRKRSRRSSPSRPTPPAT